MMLAITEPDRTLPDVADGTSESFGSQAMNPSLLRVFRWPPPHSASRSDKTGSDWAAWAKALADTHGLERSTAYETCFDSSIEQGS